MNPEYIDSKDARISRDKKNKTCSTLDLQHIYEIDQSTLAIQAFGTGKGVRGCTLLTYTVFCLVTVVLGVKFNSPSLCFFLLDGYARLYDLLAQNCALSLSVIFHTK